MRPTNRQARVDHLEQKILELRKRYAAAERSADEQRGAVLRRLLAADGHEPGAAVCRALDAALTRDADRALFGLPASPSPTPTQQSLDLNSQL